MAHYNVIVLEGGGCKGCYGFGVLEKLEDLANKHIYDFTKLVVSTSVGTVIGSLICTGNRSARDWSLIALENLPIVFKKRSWFFPLPKYDAKNYLNFYHKYVSSSFLMKDLKIWLMCTSVDRCEPRTHYFKSWEKKDGELPVSVVTTRSFAAPIYFGSISDEINKKVWMDGGMSYNNLPLMQAYIEILRQGWLTAGNTVHILAVGMGRPDNSVTFEKAKKHNIISQTLDQMRKYIDVSDGGLAREMATMEQVRSLQAISSCTSNLTFQFIDWTNLPKKLDKIDDTKDRYIYYQKGISDGSDIDIGLFKIKD